MKTLFIRHCETRQRRGNPTTQGSNGPIADKLVCWIASPHKGVRNDGTMKGA